MFIKIKHRIRNVFIAGLLVTIPIAFTFFILNFLFKNLDRALSPAFTKMLIFFGVPIQESFRIPGVGVMMTLIIIFLVGVFTTNIFGKKLVHLGERILQKIPVVRSIYTGTKQVVSTIVDADIETFSKVVLVEFPRKELFAIGFITCENKGEVQARTEEDVVNVFVPTTPNPTSGFLVFASRDQIIELSMSIEEGVKYVVSGGIVSPPFPGGKEIDIRAVKQPKDIKDLTV
ncbi:MAG: DUF502 domain-containing protein [Nitrospinales bacterium]